MNAKILNEELHYNINIWNGYSKEIVETQLKNWYKLVSIEEI